MCVSRLHRLGLAETALVRFEAIVVFNLRVQHGFRTVLLVLLRQALAEEEARYDNNSDEKEAEQHEPEDLPTVELRDVVDPRYAFANVRPGVSVGTHCELNDASGVVVDGDEVLEERQPNVHVAPQTLLVLNEDCAVRAAVRARRARPLGLVKLQWGRGEILQTDKSQKRKAFPVKYS